MVDLDAGESSKAFGPSSCSSPEPSPVASGRSTILSNHHWFLFSFSRCCEEANRITHRSEEGAVVPTLQLILLVISAI